MTGQQQTGIAAAAPFDVFVDLSDSRLDAAGLAAHLAGLARAGIGSGDNRVVIAPPARIAAPEGSAAGLKVAAATSPAEAFGRAMAGARSARRGLFVIIGAWLPGIESLAALTRLQDADPLVGTIQPRFADPETDRIFALPGRGTRRSPTLPRAAMAHLPAHVITPELPAALLFLTVQAVCAAGEPAAGGFGPAFGECLVGLRRRGFRNLVDNRVSVAFPFGPAHAYPVPAHASPQLHADAVQARRWLAGQPEQALEHILAGAFGPSGRPRLLLDCRGLQAVHNGTAQAILGFLSGFAGPGIAEFDITVLVADDAERFHQVRQRFPGLKLHDDRSDERFFATVVMNQPWAAEAIREAHQRSAVVVFNMLDTIAWDILYAAPERLDETWRVVANLADGLLFNSLFTRDRFAFRFPRDPRIPVAVTHHSLSAAELAPDAPAPSPYDEPFLFVVGNDYDHKDVAPTLATLADAFPYSRIVALGGPSSSSPRITYLRSGHIAEEEVQALMANAAAIVFPSFYEGFGLPVAQGLAYGRTVVVRRSALWEEIAAYSRLPGAVVPFDDEASLVEAVGRALHGREPRGLLSGGALGADVPAPSWRSCSQQIVGLVQQIAAGFDGERWLAREAIFRTARQRHG